MSSEASTKAENRQGKASTVAQRSLNKLFRSVSQQELRSGSNSWRRELDCIEDETIHSLATSPVESYRELPSPLIMHEKVFICQVSGTAVKRKAKAWRTAKAGKPVQPDGLERDKTPLGSARVESDKDMLTPRSSAPSSANDWKSCGAARTSQASLASSHLHEDKKWYVPSDLERLIFGNSGQAILPTAVHTTDNDTCEIESLEEERRGQRASVAGWSRTVIPLPAKGQDQRASYKAKGRASLLRLDLSGHSNMETRKMLAPAVSSPYWLALREASLTQTPATAFTSSSREQQSTSARQRNIGSQDSWLDPAMSCQASPQQAHSPSKVSDASLSLFSQSMRSQMEISPLVAAILDRPNRQDRATNEERLPSRLNDVPEDVGFKEGRRLQLSTR